MPTGERDGVSVAVSKAIDAVVGSYHPRTIGVTLRGISGHR